MNDQVERSTCCNGKRTGADRHMRVWDADQINHQGHRQNRSAAADETQRKADKAARCRSEKALHHGYHAKNIMLIAPPAVHPAVLFPLNPDSMT
jgi:hypothetical protein